MKKTFKIEIANGKLTCPELDGYELPEIEIEPIGQPLTDYVNQKRTQEECIGFIDGYNKAREKFEFTERDLRKAYDTNHYSKEDKDNQWDNFIASLRTARTPIAIEVEMVEDYNSAFGVWQTIPATNPDGTVKGRWVYE
jgi:hypothetical protein